MTRSKASAKTLPTVLNAYLFVCFFSIVFVVVTTIGGLTSLSTLKYILLYSLTWLLLPLWMPRATRPWLWTVGVICWLGSLVKLGYFAIYRQEMSQSVFFTLFDSNTSEGSEFVANYLRWWMLPALLAYTGVAVVLARRIRPLHTGPRTRIALTVIVALAFIEPFVTYWNGPTQQTASKALQKIVDRHAGIEPWQTVVSYLRYRHEVAAVDAMLQAMQQQDTTPLPLQDDTPQQTYVLVIGESTNRTRMSLYGYGRDTTPRLDSLRERLVVFDDVIATRPYTIESLAQALTLEAGSDDAPAQTNIVMLMRRAGFKTFWITNQQTISSRNTLLTAFSKMADEQRYLNNNRVQSSSHYDDVVLQPFSQALADAADRKFIVVHLLGAHIGYDHRYPSDFTRFTGANPASRYGSSPEALYNSYDNAIAYNDYIVSQLIERYEQAVPYGALLFFADHGEEVFDFRNFQGRNENDPTPQMYTVPFVLLPSASWQAANAARLAHMRSATQTPYSLADLVHGLCDLTTVQWRDCRPQQSLFSRDWHMRPRLVGDPARNRQRDYDASIRDIGGDAPALVAGVDPKRNQPATSPPRLFPAAVAQKVHD